MSWMANTTELLSYVQEKVLDMEKEADQEGLSSDPQLCSDLELCDEAMAVLDEVIMCTFQQSVYYLTKTLYSTLPALLDSNPFTAGAELPGPGAELAAMPPGLRPTLEVFQTALELTRQCELHPDLVSQTFGYLFFFSNASLLNSLMERGERGRREGQARGVPGRPPLRGSLTRSLSRPQGRAVPSTSGLGRCRFGPIWTLFWTGFRAPGSGTSPPSSSASFPWLSTCCACRELPCSRPPGAVFRPSTQP
uniref:Dilute domain-containing protein n=1 Tax=Sarcophilus harrisii TaxID=9305 RepID=A0A7N4NGI5_SARHA